MQRILVATDLTPASAAVVEQATTLAARTGADLRLIHVARPDPDFVGYDAGPPSVREDVADELRDEHRHLEQLVDRLATRGVRASYHLTRGVTADAILAEAQRIDADLVVLGTHARGPLLEALLGSVSHDVLRSAHRPVLIVPPE